jgi:predicted nucleic acid-binding protein
MAPVIADANFLLRLITKHPQPMYRAARAFALEAEREGIPIEVHPMHVAEAVYVLEGRIYGLSPRETTKGLLALLAARPFAPREEEALLAALEAYPESGLDFPDVFLAKLARTEGKRVVSFDRKIAQAGVKPLVPREE